MDLSIVILNYNTKNLLNQCLRQLKTLPFSIDYEIIVVDNNSTDGSVELVKRLYPNIELIILKKNVGFQKGNNVGIREAKGKYVLLLNTDLIFIYSLAIKEMFDFMEANPDIALLGPQLLNPDKTIQRSVMRFHKIYTPFCRRTLFGAINLGQQELARFEMTDWDHNNSQDVDWVLGACVLVRKKAIDEVGLMNEDLFLYFGDTDWARSFWQKGWRVHYLATAKIVHLHRRESADVGIFSLLFSQITRSHILDWFKYLRKWGLSSERPQSNIIN